MDAMGSHKSPPYASLSVGYIEKEAYERFRLNKGEVYVDYVIRMLRRFLDDVFIKWKLSLGDPMEFFNEINGIDCKINFTIEMGNCIPFLDVKFTLDEWGLLAVPKWLSNLFYLLGYTIKYWNCKWIKCPFS